MENELKHFIREMAAASGAFIRPYFGSADLAIELKADETPVTQADRGAEELLRRMIRERYPSHGIIGEEFGAENDKAEFVWVLDPIDGTKSFASGCPLFGTLIALLRQGEPWLGAIHQPIVGQLCLGDGKSTELNGRPVRIRKIGSLAEATFLTTDVRSVGQHRDPKGFESLMNECRLFRTWGDCYGYLLLAGGWADIMTDPVMNFWDIAALIPVIRGAGGIITDWTGGDPLRGGSTVAAGADLHPLVIERLTPRTSP